MMVGKAPVHLDEKLESVQPQFAHQRRRDHSAASVAAVDRDLERPQLIVRLMKSL